MEVLIALLIIGGFIFLYLKNKKQRNTKLQSEVLNDNDLQQILSEHVAFYRELPSDKKEPFRKRVQLFLSKTQISGVNNLSVANKDRVYVASSAIIPIFHFENWQYNNIDEVLLYEGSFNKDFDTTSNQNNILGMVGTGALNRTMLLSLPSLREGFELNTRENTGIHEFVHLLDKADGSVDGVADYLIPSSLVKPWIKEMQETISEIRKNDTEINPYGGTNEAEFFAVISEYFFQKPQQLEKHHPDLFKTLAQIYNTDTLLK